MLSQGLPRDAFPIIHHDIANEIPAHAQRFIFGIFKLVRAKILEATTILSGPRPLTVVYLPDGVVHLYQGVLQNARA
ncbi:hypothetical protein K1719_024032 [Acacia pycnantha]|nr:hypothetical protein K1719_024032 [Acacia pycnantha]